MVSVVHGVAEIRSTVAQWRAAGDTVALVPTMGNLHAGHLALVERARAVADRVVVSIFVNPLQFSGGEDFSRYPRTLDADCAVLRPLGVERVFAPDVDELYPDGQDGVTQVVVPDLSGVFCGEFRPGHFEGVTTVVTALFNIVQPDVAVFGEKDYQQLTVIRIMARQLHMPVRIEGVATVREPSGLALSSRNQYLSDDERQRAAVLAQALQDTVAALRAGERAFEALERAASARIEAEGLTVQYFAVRALNLAPPADDTRAFVVLTAAVLGAARLIDNMTVELA